MNISRIIIIGIILSNLGIIYSNKTNNTDRSASLLVTIRNKDSISNRQFTSTNFEKIELESIKNLTDNTIINDSYINGTLSFNYNDMLLS